MISEVLDKLLRQPDKARILVTSAVQGHTVSVKDDEGRNIALVSVDEAIRLKSKNQLVRPKG